MLRKLVISKKSLYEAIHHCIHCKKTFKERQKNYLIKVVRVDVDVYSRYFSQISGDKIRSKKNTKIKNICNIQSNKRLQQRKASNWNYSHKLLNTIFHVSLLPLSHLFCIFIILFGMLLMTYIWIKIQINVLFIYMALWAERIRCPCVSLMSF